MCVAMSLPGPVARVEGVPWTGAESHRSDEGIPAAYRRPQLVRQPIRWDGGIGIGAGDPKSGGAEMSMSLVYACGT